MWTKSWLGQGFSLVVMALVEHHRRIRHSNFIERTFGETRRRVKVIGRLPGETSCLNLVWAVMDRASRGWHSGFTGLLRVVDALQYNLHECIGVERVAECDRQGPHRDRGRQPLRVARPRDGVSGCMDGLLSARVGDRGWLRPLPLRGEPQGAALTLRTQHSPGFAAYQPCWR